MVATYVAPFPCVSQTQASNFLRKFSTWATKPSARHLRGYQPWLSFPAPLRASLSRIVRRRSSNTGV